jgi:hypothetical protein
MRDLLLRKFGSAPVLSSFTFLIPDFFVSYRSDKKKKKISRQIVQSTAKLGVEKTDDGTKVVRHRSQSSVLVDTPPHSSPETSSTESPSSSSFSRSQPHHSPSSLASEVHPEGDVVSTTSTSSLSTRSPTSGAQPIHLKPLPRNVPAQDDMDMKLRAKRRKERQDQEMKRRSMSIASDNPYRASPILIAAVTGSGRTTSGSGSAIKKYLKLENALSPSPFEDIVAAFPTARSPARSPSFLRRSQVSSFSSFLGEKVVKYFGIYLVLFAGI